MSVVSDPSKPFPAGLHVIRRLNHSLNGAGGGKGPEPEPGLHRPAQRVALAPSRHDIPLLDPCCGQLSAGAEVDLGVKGRQKFIDFHHVASALWVPPGFQERPRTAPKPPGVCVDLSENKAWSYRRIPDAVVKPRISGSTTAKVQPTHLRLTDKHTGPQEDISSDVRLWTDSEAVRRFVYTSTTHRSYEKVGWETKFPRCLNAPETTPTRMADRGPSWRRNNSRPQLWQSIGAEWSRQQLRPGTGAKKPISFCSGCPRSGQIPLCTGTIGSENIGNIDDVDKTFQPLTLKRSTMPPHTPTARRTTIPGYTGRAAYADAALCVPAPAGSSGAIGRPVASHAAPLSRMVTTAAPCNPFLRLPVSHTNTQRH